MSRVVTARYTCDKCVQTRNIRIEMEKLESKIFIPENSSNGLFVYSDIHRCENGILGINNLHIDNNNDVRSFEYLKLPTEKNGRKVMSGLPSPNMPKQDLKKYRITSMAAQIELRLIIIDKDLRIHLIVGNIMEEYETPVSIIESRRKGITLKFYESDVNLTDQVRDWLQTLIDLLEVLPPTKIGLFIDTLRYISTLTKIQPVKFHTDMLRTILSSHEIVFALNNKDEDFVELMSEKEEIYGGDMIIVMLQLLETLVNTPNASLQEFTILRKKEISDLVYMFLLLEQEGIVTIQRPPNVEL